ncbi:MAG: glycosyltransferase family 2 protein [Cytophagales bacterium]|nr:glycosyltransferase family 2 protein [Cytophagales bacterium]
MTLSVVIVSYNVCYFLEQCIKSVIAAGKGLSYEIIVADNHSADGSVAMLRSKFGHITVIENANNEGFSKANNKAIKIAKGEYILLLNPDTVIEEDTLKKCVDFMQSHIDAGAMGVYMVDGKGQYLPESKRGLPTPWVAFYKICGLAKIFPKSTKFGKYHLGYLDRHQTHEVDILSGAFMCIRKSVLEKVGLLDEDFFMYGEDIDLSYRILKAGYKNYYYPHTKIIHYKGESTKRTSVNYVLVFYGAMIIFAQKHFLGSGAFVFKMLIKTAIFARAAFALVERFFIHNFQFLSWVVVAYSGLIFIVRYWAQNFKHSTHYYPDNYFYFILPAYTLIWIISLYYNGAFDKPYKSYRVIRGVVTGTMVIAALSNFYDLIRFSKAVILLGSIWAILCTYLNRGIINMMLYKKIFISDTHTKNAVIVAAHTEYERVTHLLLKSKANIAPIGFISPNVQDSQYNYYLGDVQNTAQIISVYKPDEVIFCSINIDTQHIIDVMMQVSHIIADYKIVPPGSDFVIGSHHANAPGELYSLDIKMNLFERNNMRNKRVLDIVLSAILLLTSPIFVWFQHRKASFFSNMWHVLTGRYTFVYISTDMQNHKIHYKTALLYPHSEFDDKNIDANTIHHLSHLYAQNYETAMDLRIIWNNRYKLG